MQSSESRIKHNNLIRMNGIPTSILPLGEPLKFSYKKRKFKLMLDGLYFFHEICPTKGPKEMARDIIRRPDIKALGITLSYETCVDESGLARKFIYMSAEDYGKWPYKNSIGEDVDNYRAKSSTKIGSIFPDRTLLPASGFLLVETTNVPPKERKFSPFLNGSYFVHEIDKTKNPVNIARQAIQNKNVAKLGLTIYYQTCIDKAGCERKFIYMSAKDYQKWPYRKLTTMAIVHPPQEHTQELLQDENTVRYKKRKYYSEASLSLTSTTTNTTTTTTTSTTSQDDLLTLDSDALQLFSGLINVSDLPDTNSSIDLGYQESIETQVQPNENLQQAPTEIDDTLDLSIFLDSHYSPCSSVMWQTSKEIDETAHNVTYSADSNTDRTQGELPSKYRKFNPDN